MDIEGSTMLSRVNRRSEKTLSVSVIVPAYNEQDTIEIVLRSLLASLPNVHEIVVVDDGSMDETAKIAQTLGASESRIRVIQLGKNQGKTAALKEGFAASTGDVVLVQDADLEYDPKDTELSRTNSCR